MRKNHPTSDKKPVDQTRRGLLVGLGALSACPFAAQARQVSDAVDPNTNVTTAPSDNAKASDRVSPFGTHQSGIVTPRPANGLIASFSVAPKSLEDVEAMFRKLSERIFHLTSGSTITATDPKLPPPDSGILGAVLRPDALTVTVSLGASFFDDRPELSHLRPKHLVKLMRFRNDRPDKSIMHGDLTLQICANNQDTNIHALRDIIKNLSKFLILKWKQEGNVPVVTPSSDGTAESARNFLGFKDGSANPDASDGTLMDELIWVSNDNAEPDWAGGGSYQAVRIIRNFVERWDRTPLGEQEAIIGRSRLSGAPLDALDATEFQAPLLESDPEGKFTALDAHIRLANPRSPDSRKNLLLRRPFNYSNGVTKSGQLDQGLLFICYQNNLQNGFIAVQRRLDGEPLEEYIKPVGGGFYFTLPGCSDSSDYFGRSLVEAARKNQKPL